MHIHFSGKDRKKQDEDDYFRPVIMAADVNVVADFISVFTEVNPVSVVLLRGPNINIIKNFYQ